MSFEHLTYQSYIELITKIALLGNTSKLIKIANHIQENTSLNEYDKEDLLTLINITSFNDSKDVKIKRYAANSKVAQDWIKHNSLDSLKIGQIYDDLGLFERSEKVYKSTRKIASFIKISQEENQEENIENTQEEPQQEPQETSQDLVTDADSFHIQNINNNRYQVGDVSKITDIGMIESNPEIKASRQHVNSFVRALANGGSNVKSSLDHLAEEVGRWSLANSFQKEILVSLSFYYNNPLFNTSDQGYLLKQELLTDDIIKGDIDQDTVSLIAYFHNEAEEKKTRIKSLSEQINNILKEIKPELADNQNAINFIISNNPHWQPEFSDYDIKVVKMLANKIDNNSLDKALMFIEEAKALSISQAFGTNLYNAGILISFFNMYPQDIVYNNLLNIIKQDRGMFEFIITSGSHKSIERILFGALIEIPQQMKKLYPNLAEELARNPLNQNYRINSIIPNYLNPTLIAEAPISTVGMTHDDLSRYYFNKHGDDALEDMRELYPDIDNDLWLAVGHKMITMDRANGKKAFDNINIIWPRYKNELIKELTPSLFPVYIKYFSNYLSTKNAYIRYMNQFNLCYLYIGDKIFLYTLQEIDKIGGTYDADRGNNRPNTLSIEQYEIIKQHSGDSILDNPDDIYSKVALELYFTNPYAYNIPWETLRNFIDANQNYHARSLDSYVKNLFILGTFDKELFNTVSDIETRLINDNTKDYFKKLVTEYKKSPTPFIGNFGYLLSVPPTAKKPESQDLSLTEIANSKNTEEIYKIREAIAKSKNYSHITKDSEEYNKLFILFSKNFNIRGRDPEMLITLVDSTIDSENNSRASQQFHYMAQALGTSDFSKLSRTASDILSSIDFKKDLQNAFLNDQFYYQSSIKPEHIINLGGFDALFNMTEEQLKEWLEKIRLRNPEKAITAWNEYKAYPDKFSNIYLKMDKNILYNKVLNNFYNQYFNTLKAKDQNIFQNLEEGSDFDITLKNTINDARNRYKSYINLNLSCGKDCEQELLNVYKTDVKLPKKITLPTWDKRETMTSFLNDEGLTNIGKIVQIFGNLTLQILDTYSFDLCRKNGYPTKGYQSVPDLKLKGKILHDFANLLPNNMNQKFPGYPQYFLKNLPYDKKGDLKYVGEMWNSLIKIWDDNDNVLEEAFVYQFSSKYNPTELAKIIKQNSFRHVMKDLPVEDKTFAYEFCENIGLPTEQDKLSNSYKELYAGTQKVYLDGLKVELPDWANYKGKSNDLTLRFLKRDEPEGMFLGLKSKCCQEPRNFAASCAYDGHLNKNAAFAVFESHEGLIFQSYVWNDKEGNVCFDSIESPKYDYNKTYGEDAEILMVDFAKTLPEGKICNVGQNHFNFETSKKTLVNHTQTNEIPYVAELLINYSPKKNIAFYNSDSKTQYYVGEGKDQPNIT